MRKVLLACDGPHFSSAAFDFIRHMNEEENVMVTGVFLSSASQPSLWKYTNGITGPLMLPVAEPATVVAGSIAQFEAACLREGMDYCIHKDDEDFAIRELKEESRFADLLLVGSSCFYSTSKGHPNAYLMALLQEAECPVIAVPETYQYPEKIVLTYDGSASSVFAIKQFAYLFPQWKHKPTLLVFAGKGNALPYQVHMEELASRHFTDLTIEQLPIDPLKYMTTWLENNKNTIVVTGSAGHAGWLSLFTKKDFVTELLEDHHEHFLYEQKLDGNCLPVFISHR